MLSLLDTGGLIFFFLFNSCEIAVLIIVSSCVWAMMLKKKQQIKQKL